MRGASICQKGDPINVVAPIPPPSSMSYGPDTVAIFVKAASYVDRILKGDSPAEMPVEQPTTFRFTINFRAAKALGLAIPESVLAQADEVID